MRCVLIGLLLFVIGWQANANEPTQGNKPLTKEQLEKIEAGYKALDSIDELKKMLDVAMKARNFACIKAFGHDGFCKCLNENLAVGLDFSGYVHILTHTKEQLKYNSLSEEDKQLVDSAIKSRDKCVKTLESR